jgi:hypothetical protein
VDPKLETISDDADWTNEDWSLGVGSGAIDAADPSSDDDPDGSPGDIGAFGGTFGAWTP